MARVTCRCGEAIEAPGGGVEKVVCPRCRTRIRIRRPSDRADDGYIRFPCPCGRRLKVRAASGIEAGKCPDCGRVVPIPDQTAAGSLRAGVDDAEARTDEFDKADVARLARWAARHGVPADVVVRPPSSPKPGRPALPPTDVPETPPQTPPPSPPPTFRRESGLRVCPRCHQPLHMNATVCRSCGESTPKG
jgi:ribosomal protein L40E